MNAIRKIESPSCPLRPLFAKEIIRFLLFDQSQQVYFDGNIGWLSVGEFTFTNINYQVGSLDFLRQIFASKSFTSRLMRRDLRNNDLLILNRYEMKVRKYGLEFSGWFQVSTGILVPLIEDASDSGYSLLIPAVSILPEEGFAEAISIYCQWH